MQNKIFSVGNIFMHHSHRSTTFLDKYEKTINPSPNISI